MKMTRTVLAAWLLFLACHASLAIGQESDPFGPADPSAPAAPEPSSEPLPEETPAAETPAAEAPSDEAPADDAPATETPAAEEPAPAEPAQPAAKKLESQPAIQAQPEAPKPAAPEAVPAPTVPQPLPPHGNDPYAPGPMAASCDDGCCGCCGPTCYAGIEMLFYQRNEPRRIRLAEDGDGGGPRGQRPTLLTTDDFDYDNADGIRATIGTADECRRLEVSYLGIFDWEDERHLLSTSNPFDLDLPFDGQVDSNFDGVERIHARYEADLHSVEINCIGNDPCRLLQPLAGVRYLNYNENFNLLAVEGDGRMGRYDIETDNDLIGLQAGVLAERCLGSVWRWNFVGKVGGYWNFAHQDTRLTADDGAVVYRNYGNGEEEFAFVGELGLNLIARVTCRCEVMAGYNLLWIDGLALAPEQLDFRNAAGAGSGLDHDGDVFFHGWSIGLRVWF